MGRHHAADPDQHAVSKKGEQFMAEKKAGPVAVLDFGDGRTVKVRELTNKDEMAAIRVLGQSEVTNPLAFAAMAGREMLKLIVVEVDGKVPSASEREMIPDLLGERVEAVLEFVQEQKSLAKKNSAKPTVTFETGG